MQANYPHPQRPPPPGYPASQSSPAPPPGSSSAQRTTTTTTTTTQSHFGPMGAASVAAATTKVSPLVHFDQNYVRTQSGAIKIACMLLSLIGYICAQASGSVAAARAGGAISYYSIVSMIAFWITFILFALYVFHVVEMTPGLRWFLFEAIYCGVLSVFFLFAAFLIVFYRGALAAAGFFGFWATFLYALDAYLKYEAHIRGECPQGSAGTGTGTANANGGQSSGRPAAPRLGFNV